MSGMGILLSTHNPDHALVCADRIVMLCGGRVVGAGPPAELITSANLKTLYGVDVDVQSFVSGNTTRTLCVPRVERSTQW
jgi:iron complex transport system ATP-binding protein